MRERERRQRLASKFNPPPFNSGTPPPPPPPPSIVELIENWDLERTESLLEKLEVKKERRREDERKRKEAEASK